MSKRSHIETLPRTKGSWRGVGGGEEKGASGVGPEIRQSVLSQAWLGISSFSRALRSFCSCPLFWLASFNELGFGFATLIKRSSDGKYICILNSSNTTVWYSSDINFIIQKCTHRLVPRTHQCIHQICTRSLWWLSLWVPSHHSCCGMSMPPSRLS